MTSSIPNICAAFNPKVFENTRSHPGKRTRNIQNVPKIMIQGIKVAYMATPAFASPQKEGSDDKYILLMNCKIHANEKNINIHIILSLVKYRYLNTKKRKQNDT
jgi:hypothetical protein